MDITQKEIIAIAVKHGLLSKSEHLYTEPTYQFPKDGYENDVVPKIEIFVADIRAQLSLSKPVDGWISVEDRLPEIDTLVLVIVGSNFVPVRTFKLINSIFSETPQWYDPMQDSKCFTHFVKYWKPLPVLPINASPKPIGADKDE